jgi:hypothetical protein
MKLNPIYSYEFNYILNDSLTEKEQIQNFASLISDKDRFLSLLGNLEKNSKFIEEKLGFKLEKNIDFYVVRSLKFKSFSPPITIEYSILPEEMIVFLLKEIIKFSINIRFIDEKSKEEHINSLIDFILVNGDFKNSNFIKYSKNIHDDSIKKISDYKLLELDFNKKTLKEYIEDSYLKL